MVTMRCIVTLMQRLLERHLIIFKMARLQQIAETETQIYLDVEVAES